MCRLYGSRSQNPESAHAHLALVRNSLVAQSREHKDGWGIAHYAESESPKLHHGLQPAHADPTFDQACRAVSARTILAHIRLASVGEVTPVNAHPFSYGPWAFAHNGTVRNYAEHRAEMERAIAPKFRSLIRGDTDSERCFFMFLTQLESLGAPDALARVEDVVTALAHVAAAILRVADALPADPPSALNFLATDGRVMAALRRGKSLFYSECNGRRSHESQPRDGDRLERLVIASEALSREDAWFEVPDASAVAVDESMTLSLWSASQLRAA